MAKAKAAATAAKKEEGQESSQAAGNGSSDGEAGAMRVVSVQPIDVLYELVWTDEQGGEHRENLSAARLTRRLEGAQRQVKQARSAADKKHWQKQVEHYQWKLSHAPTVDS